jgi:hypothetical protein
VTETATLDRACVLGEHASWTEAYDVFTVPRRRGRHDADDLERLGEAAWWIAHPAESTEAFECAYTAYSAEGNQRCAAYVAPPRRVLGGRGAPVVRARPVAARRALARLVPLG